MKKSMINPSIVDLLNKIDSRYALVTITSKRARQLIEGEKPLIDTEITKPLSVAINEINDGVVTFEAIKESSK